MDARAGGKQGMVPSSELVGRTLEGRYRIDRFLARGGMGEVYAGVDTTLQRPVAVKFLAEELSAEAELVQRFLREAQDSAKLEHPNLVPVYAAGRLGARPYFVMRFLRGRTLADWIAASGRLPVVAAVDIAAQVCEGLELIHRSGFVHRDIKPQNLMVEPDGRCVILDLGILRRVDQSLTATGVITGTPAYIAPEQARDPKRVDGRADLYALGVTLFEMLTAQLPFRAHSALDLILKHQSAPAPRPSALVPELPGFLDSIVLQLLAKEPGLRYQSARELKTALVAARAELELLHANAKRATASIVVQPPAGAAPLESSPEPKSGLPGAAERPKPALGTLSPRLSRSTVTAVSIALVVIVGIASGLFVARQCGPGAELRTNPEAPTFAEKLHEKLVLDSPIAKANRAHDELERMQGVRTGPDLRGAPPPPVPAAPLPPLPSAETAPAEVLPEGRGQLSVSSLPAEAEVYLEGKRVGRTPFEVLLAPGQYKVELRGPKVLPHTETARVTEGRSERVHVALKAQPARLEVVTKGRAGIVTIDREKVGEGERVVSELPPGRHVVRVHAGRQTVMREVQLEAAESKTIELELDPAPVFPVRSRSRR